MQNPGLLRRTRPPGSCLQTSILNSEHYLSLAVPTFLMDILLEKFRNLSFYFGKLQETVKYSLSFGKNNLSSKDTVLTKCMITTFFGLLC